MTPYAAVMTVWVDKGETEAHVGNNLLKIMDIVKREALLEQSLIHLIL